LILDKGMKMKRVLLTINGKIPTKSVFQYSVGLCKMIHAELTILQFISSTRRRVGHLGKFLENSFAGVAFAEQGVHSMAMEFMPGISNPLKEMIELKEMEMPFKVGLSRGNPETELSNYIENHQEIILTVFDPSKDSKKNPKYQLEMIEQIKKRLCIPLVMVK